MTLIFSDTLNPDPEARVNCDNCDWEGQAEDLLDIPDFEERVSAGEVVPAGECPACGCLAHVQPTVNDAWCMLTLLDDRQVLKVWQRLINWRGGRELREDVGRSPGKAEDAQEVILATEELRLGDIVETADGPVDPFGHCLVCGVSDDAVELFRPFAHHSAEVYADTSIPTRPRDKQVDGRRVLTYTGTETWQVHKGLVRRWRLLRRSPVKQGD